MRKLFFAFMLFGLLYAQDYIEYSSQATTPLKVLKVGKFKIGMKRFVLEEELGMPNTLDMNNETSTTNYFYYDRGYLAVMVCDTLKQVTFYSSIDDKIEGGKYKKYAGEMPGNLKISFTKDQVENILGKPERYFTYKNLPVPFTEYEYTRYNFKFTFDDNTKKIITFTVGL